MTTKKDFKVALLGPEGSYTFEAAEKAFPGGNFLLLSSIKKVFDSVIEKKADFGVVPIENSTDGSITATLDLLSEKNLMIYAELLLDINHCFLSNETDFAKIDRIFSHPQGFAQCRSWIENNYPKCELIECGSTSEAAKKAFTQKGASAIASLASAKKYSLKIIEKGIQDLIVNKTRFAIFSLPEKINPFYLEENKSKYKVSLLFAVKDKPGSLFDAIKSFKEFGVNMTKIESRPSKRNVWEYVFFVDIEGKLDSSNVSNALDELNKHCEFVKVLGCYKEI